MARANPQESYVTSSVAAAIFHVSPKTINRWSRNGKLPFLTTPGGHRRYPEHQLRQLARSLREEPTP